jgi:hypothetical protein
MMLAGPVALDYLLFMALLTPRSREAGLAAGARTGYR